MLNSFIVFKYLFKKKECNFYDLSATNIIEARERRRILKYFEGLYKAYHKDIFRFLYKLSNNNVDLAEELTQETFYYAYLEMSKFKGEGHIKTWLMGIAKNRFFMYLRKNKNITVSIDEILNDVIEDTVSIQDTLINRQLLTNALNIVFDMKGNMRDVFLARIYSDSSYSQISRSLGISESSAKVLFFRAKQQLQKQLRESYNYEI